MCQECYKIDNVLVIYDMEAVHYAYEHLKTCMADSYGCANYEKAPVPS